MAGAWPRTSSGVEAKHCSRCSVDWGGAGGWGLGRSVSSTGGGDTAIAFGAVHNGMVARTTAATSRTALGQRPVMAGSRRGLRRRDRPPNTPAVPQLQQRGTPADSTPRRATGLTGAPNPTHSAPRPTITDTTPAQLACRGTDTTSITKATVTHSIPQPTSAARDRRRRAAVPAASIPPRRQRRTRRRSARVRRRGDRTTPPMPPRPRLPPRTPPRVRSAFCGHEPFPRVRLSSAPPRSRRPQSASRATAGTAVIDNFAATLSVARAAVVSSAPATRADIVHATPQAETVAVSVDMLARAVKHAVPQSVTRSSTIDAVMAAAAARHRLAADGPAGTARKPATAVNTTAAMESTKHGSGSGWVRRRTTAATAAADAITAAVTALPTAPETMPDAQQRQPRQRRPPTDTRPHQ